jgi:hypothetical protein
MATPIKITPEVKERVAELIGTICTYPEAAGAVGISERSVTNIMADPEYRKKMEDIKAARNSASAMFAAEVRSMMAATNADGTPDMSLRRAGLELYGKHPELVDTDIDAGDDAMLPGVVMRFPREKFAGTEIPTFTEEDLAYVPVEAEL